MAGTYGIRGLPRPSTAQTKTKVIPYVTDLPVRYEISVLANSKDPDLRRQWTLFVFALENFKRKSVDERLSYFQVAGIHGYPETSWDGAEKPRQSPDTPPEKPDPGAQPFGGYCNHNGLNFPTWHRPYMLLFEVCQRQCGATEPKQCIWENMKEVIKHWKTKHLIKDEKTWLAAANLWRMPYWDWARHQSYTQDFAYPKVMTQASVRIFPPPEVADYYPGGVFPNPLWGFENPEKDSFGDPRPFGAMPEGKTQWNIKDDPPVHKKEIIMNSKADDFWLPWSRCTGISRYGITVNHDRTDFQGLDGVNNPFQANNSLASLRLLKEQDPDYPKQRVLPNPGNLADSVNRMFTNAYNTTWGEFASTKWENEHPKKRKTGYMSLEYIHNNVHNMVGGSNFLSGAGHMSDVPVAAFDPIFWLHHTQIGRLLSIWQCLYPDLWFDKQEDPDPCNVRDDTCHDPLQPFHLEDGGRADDENNIYTAKKCRDWTELNYQYDDLMALSKGALDSEGNLDELVYQQHLRNYINDTYPSTANLVKPLQGETEGLTGEKDNTWKDYIISVVYDRYALKGASYAIEFYLGGANEVRETLVKRENFVGQVYTFGGGGGRTEGSCANCTKQAGDGTLSCAQVPLTISLLHHALDESEDHNISDFTEIESYLQLHLSWRYVGPGGVVLCPSKFTDTKIEVYQGIGELREPKRAPVLPRPESLKVGASNEQLYSLELGTEAPTKYVQPALYGGYQLLPNATAGKDGLSLEKARLRA
ncbi:unnamed protein product [Clonostachys solani]|uniref:tyrosinase n=1 Tax=Clonostachys solani TaxID=160281 RepID=A0A9P0ENW0_9HYPO|nr:unnamed protein product [Clonostachys solani]